MSYEVITHFKCIVLGTLLRNIFNREEIGKARRVVLSCLDKHWNLIDTSLGPLDEGHCQGDSKGMCLTGFTSVTHHQDVLNILEGQKLFNLFTNLLNEQPLHLTINGSEFILNLNILMNIQTCIDLPILLKVYIPAGFL